MSRDYIERRDESLYLIGSRIPLARIVYEFRNGETAEAIQSNFPTLTLEQVYGAIAFYLANQAEADNDAADREQIEDEFIKAHPNPPGLRRTLLERQKQLLPQA